MGIERVNSTHGVGDQAGIGQIGRAAADAHSAFAPETLAIGAEFLQPYAGFVAVSGLLVEQHEIVVRSWHASHSFLHSWLVHDDQRLCPDRHSGGIELLRVDVGIAGIGVFPKGDHAVIRGADPEPPEIHLPSFAQGDFLRAEAHHCKQQCHNHKTLFLHFCLPLFRS